MLTNRCVNIYGMLLLYSQGRPSQSVYFYLWQSPSTSITSVNVMDTLQPRDTDCQLGSLKELLTMVYTALHPTLHTAYPGNIRKMLVKDLEHLILSWNRTSSCVNKRLYHGIIVATSFWHAGPSGNTCTLLTCIFYALLWGCYLKLFSSQRADMSSHSKHTFNSIEKRDLPLLNASL